MTDAKGCPKACHNCRRQRLKCDQSLPHCLKCTRTGQQCLGYQRLYRWERGVASRGKMAGLTFGKAEGKSILEAHSQRSTISTSTPRQRPWNGNAESSLLAYLADPLYQDLDDISRKYLSYFNREVCKDLVLYDTLHSNRFRDLIPMAHQHPNLLHIIIANSALRMSNACQKVSIVDTGSLSLSQCRGTRNMPRSGPSLTSYKHALAAKQLALHLLQSSINTLVPYGLDATLAVVLLFIDFELIDAGRDSWTYHVDGAKKLIKTILEPEKPAKVALGPLRRFLISHCLVYDILGSTLACSLGPSSNEEVFEDSLSLLQDAEGNHCSSFPTALLRLVQEGARLLQSDPQPSPESKQHQVAVLLVSAQAFDVHKWATQVQLHSPATDFLPRMHVAAAICCAVCIYLIRVYLSLSPNSEPPEDLELLVEDALHHLSYIDDTSALFKATPWAAFVAGAETNVPARQEWVARRFLELWEVQRWGNIREALGVLETIWREKREQVLMDDRKDGVKCLKTDGNWIRGLRGKGVYWLII